MHKPQKNEYMEYFQNYVNLSGEGDFFELFIKNKNDTIRFFSEIPDDKQSYRYEEGKWTPKQVLMHLIDTERVFAYRAFVCSRMDGEMVLGSYEDNLYADNTDVSNRSMLSLLDEFIAVRNASEAIFANLNEEQSKFVNKASGNPASARALGYIMIGHIEHHFNVVNERYL